MPAEPVPLSGMVRRLVVAKTVRRRAMVSSRRPKKTGIEVARARGARERR